MTVPAPTTAALLAAFMAVRAERPRRPFNWRSNNCCHFAAEWVHYATRHNPMAGLDATPDARSALRLVRTLGGSLPHAWAAQLGRAPIDPATARTGDVVLLPTAALLAAPTAGVGHVAGVCNGRHAVVMADDGAAHFVALSLADAAFRLHPDPA